MLMSNKLPLLRRMRINTVINHDAKEKKKGSLLILNVKDVTNIPQKLGPINITSNNLMEQVYTDKRVFMKIGTTQIQKNLGSDRAKHYDEISKSAPYLKGIQEGRLGLGYNVVYDLMLANSLFDQNTGAITRTKKPQMYWDYIFRFIGDKFDHYNYKTMVIPVEDFSIDLIDAIQGKESSVNPIGYLYRLMKNHIDDFLKMGDIDIIITNKMDSLRVNPSDCARLIRAKKNANVASMFRRELFKLMNKPDPEEDTVSSAERIMSTKVNGRVTTMSIIDEYVGGATGDVPEEVKEKIVKAVEKAADKVTEEGSAATKTNIEQKVDNNAELIKAIAKDTTNKSMKQTASTKRDELLREQQLDVVIKDKTVKDLMNVVSTEVKIKTNDVTDKVQTLNTNVTKIRYPNINKAYVENLLDKDLANIFTGLNDKSIPVFVRNISVEDTSDISNYKDTYTVELEDSLRVRHKFVFDFPKIVEGKFLYLGGNRKYINNQQLLLPIVKTKPNEVQLVSSYNKIFIRRYGDKVSSVNEKMKKALGTPNSTVRVTLGKFDTENKDYVTTIEYDDFSKSYKEIFVGDVKISFNQADIRKDLLSAGIKGLEDKLDRELLPLGMTTKGRGVYYCIDLKSNEVVEIGLDGKTNNTGLGLIDFILDKSPELSKVVSDQSSGKKYMYNRATIMTKHVPIILLLAYFEGIDGILKKANVKHYFSDTRPRTDSDETVIQFKDGYLVYSQKPYENALLMNGLLDVPTKNYNYDDFNDKFAYQSIFETMFGRRNIANAFDNFLDNFLDPMTLDVLKTLVLPTDLTGMILYANKLLADNQFTSETTASLYRIRSVEVLNAILYKHVAKAYEKYKETSHYTNPQKISIKKDAVIKDVMMQQIIEDYSELNPISENQKLHGCTKKGPSGCNLAQAYTEEQRSFHKSMTGLFTISSSPDANVGVQRVLTMEPPIMNPRGLIENKVLEGKLDDYTDVNLFGVAEMLTTSGAQRDDGIRTAMSTKQATHVTPVAKSSPSLVTNGAEQVIQYHLSKDWTFIAKENGKVKELDNKTGLMIVEYESGKCDAVSINNRIAKNGAGGFHLSKQMIPRFKVGESFTKNDILAQDRDFFSDNKIYGSKFNIGSLQKVALLSSAMTFEDSSYITKDVSKDMASEIVMQKQAVVGPNTNIDFIVKVGDKVSSGDELLRFEKSFNEEGLNSLLFNIGEDMKEDIMMSSKEKVKSKFSGVVEDIKIYSTVELDELSPSLRKLVNGHYNEIKNRQKMLDKYDSDNNGLIKCGMLFNEPTGKVEANNGKFRGAIVNDGVLIEFYIKVHDELGVGDKLVFFSALKSIVGTVIEEGQEAYTLYRPEEKIGAVLSCNSLISRGVTSCPLMMTSNKLLIELSRKLRKIYEK